MNSVQPNAAFLRYCLTALLLQPCSCLLGAEPSAVVEPEATPTARIKTMAGFQTELLYSVPAKTQGSWVALCADPKGRLIVGDQYGGLYRFVPPAPGKTLNPDTIEKVPAKIRAANGLLWAFDALYVGVNDYQDGASSGVYRVTDSDGDDRLDHVELLRGFKAGVDHGVHAIVLGPDKRSLFLVTGNNTDLTACNTSRVPRLWGEDHLLPRMPDGRGHNRDRLGPGGIIYRFSPDGKEWEAYSIGYRNSYDAAFNADGELFTFDADMEYDFNTPWYRPTRINHVTSGSEYGWRNGTGKRFEWYPDNLPPVLNIGPGSPTGVVFGYGAKFPARYQNALFCLDWSWGKLFAVHLEPDGSSYKATKEEFLSGTPLPLTDAIILPKDGAMYFAIGGRKVQSGLYRVTYTGAESTAPAKPVRGGQKERDVRRSLERFHGRVDPKAVNAAWDYLDSDDRFIRWAARTVLEHQPTDRWAKRTLKEENPERQVTALLGLARATGIDPFHRKPSDPPVDFKMGGKILVALAAIPWSKLNREQRITLVRTYEICMVRFGRPETKGIQTIRDQLEPHFPARSFELNTVLCETLAYLQSTNVAAKAIALIQSAPTQEEQMEYARSLRLLQAGWTKELRTAYFNWFLTAANYRGGASFEKFIEFIRNDALTSLNGSEKKELAELLAKRPVKKSPLEALAEGLAGRSLVKEWTLEELAAAVQTGLKNRDFQQGRKVFGVAGCFACHRFGNQGGMTGPDLTGARGRFSPRDLLDEIIHPNKVINEQFVPIVVMMDDGDTVTGTIVNLNGDQIMINTDATDPNEQARVNRNRVKSIEPSKVSPMPEGLLNMLEREEILDLVAYILSGGDPGHNFYKRP